VAERLDTKIDGVAEGLGGVSERLDSVIGLLQERGASDAG
jgi:hypothetical protein